MSRWKYALVLVAFGTATVAAALGAPAQAVPGSPGTAQIPPAVFVEGFQGLVPGTLNNTPVAIGGFHYTDQTTGATAGYYADPAWNAGAGNCNGWVLNFNSAVPNPGDGCASANGGATGTGQATSWWFLQHMAAFLGYMAVSGGYETGPLDYATNNVVASQTNGGTAANGYRQPAGIQAQAANVVMTHVGHYYAVAVDFAEVHCPNFPGGNSNWSYASETLFMEINGTYVPMLGDGTLNGGINICNAAGRTKIVQPTQAMTGIAGWQSTYFAYTHLVSRAYRATSSLPLGLRVYNAQVEAVGNDVAFDNLRIVDVTPQVDKAFSPAQIPAGGTSLLTWTITNTADLDAKAGFSFTDTLPAGVTAVAGTGATTCSDPSSSISPQGSAVIAAGGTTVTVSGSLAEGAASCTASVQVTSDATGRYTNDGSNLTSVWGVDPPATCSDRDATGTCRTTPPGGATLTVVSNPALTVTKTAWTGAASATRSPIVQYAGHKVTYTITVANSGDVPISGLALDDAAGFTGSGTLSAASCAPIALGGTLAVPGQPDSSTTCTVTYTATQTDIDRGTPIVNSATASGHGLGQPPGARTTSNTAQATVGIEPSSSALSLRKDVTITSAGGTAQTTIAAAGDLLHYTYAVTNTGATTITGLTIDEGTAGDYTGVDRPGFTGTTPLAITCPATTLAPGDTTTCTATYAVTLDDLDRAEVLNAARALGVDSAGQPVASAVSAAMATIDQAPALTLTKDHNPLTRTPAYPGDTVTFRFVVTNDGNTLLTEVGVTDSLINIESPIECPAGQRGELSEDGKITLEAHESVECTASYTLTQADIDAGELTNLQAQAHGVRTTTTTDPISGDLVTTEDEVHSPFASNTLDLPAGPGLDLVKSVAIPAGGITAAGQTLTYSFLVTNTGNVTLTSLFLSDPGGRYVDATTPGFSGTGICNWTIAICPRASLAAGASETCSATYDVTQADIDSGALRNTATVTGLTPPGAVDVHGAPVTSVTSGPRNIQTPITPVARLALDKRATPATVTQAGTAVTYTYALTNTGNVTLTDPAVSETTFTGTGTPPTASCPAGPVAPGTSVECTATYTVTAADIEAGVVHNTATASATDPATAVMTSPPASFDVAATRAGALTLVKSSTQTSYHDGDRIDYTFTVTNSGNVIVDGLSVSEDSTTGTGALGPVTCPVTTLAPGASTVCTALYHATAADMDAGWIWNYATAHGAVRVTGAPVSSQQQSYDIIAAKIPDLEFVKTASPSDPAQIHEGTVVTYSFHITNAGGVPVTDPQVIEHAFTGHGPLSALTCPSDAAAWPSGVVGLLEVGDSITCTTTYTVTAADIAAGELLNTALSTGTALVYVRGEGLEPEPIVSEESTAVTPVAVTPVVAPPVAMPAGGGVPGFPLGPLGLALALLGLAWYASSLLQRRLAR